MNVNNLLDLYTDYLILIPGTTTATGLSVMVDNKDSHDKIASSRYGELPGHTILLK